MWTALRRGGLAALPFPSVILTKVRIQGCGALSCLALGPHFRQDDGLGWPCAPGQGARGGGSGATGERPLGETEKRIAPA